MVCIPMQDGEYVDETKCQFSTLNAFFLRVHYKINKQLKQ